MASTKDYLEYILEQVAELGGVNYRAMMGEFIIYYEGKVIGGIYDNRFLVKPTAAAKRLMPEAPSELPYEGGKPMLLVEDTDNRELLQQLLPAIAAELPAPKQKKQK